MKKINVVDLELFECLLEGNIDNVHYDLHNEFECTRINHKTEEEYLVLDFVNDSRTIFCQILFTSVRIVKLLVDITEREENVLDLFYKGRFVQNEQAIESTNEKDGYMYLDFVNDTKLEFWCESIVISIRDL